MPAFRRRGVRRGSRGARCRPRTRPAAERRAVSAAHQPTPGGLGCVMTGSLKCHHLPQERDGLSLPGNPGLQGPWCDGLNSYVP